MLARKAGRPLLIRKESSCRSMCGLAKVRIVFLAKKGTIEVKAATEKHIALDRLAPQIPTLSTPSSKYSIPMMNRLETTLTLIEYLTLPEILRKLSKLKKNPDSGNRQRAGSRYWKANSFTSPWAPTAESIGRMVAKRSEATIMLAAKMMRTVAVNMRLASSPFFCPSLSDRTTDEPTPKRSLTA